MLSFSDLIIDAVVVIVVVIVVVVIIVVAVVVVVQSRFGAASAQTNIFSCVHRDPKRCLYACIALTGPPAHHTPT